MPKVFIFFLPLLGEVDFALTEGVSEDVMERKRNDE